MDCSQRDIEIAQSIIAASNIRDLPERHQQNMLNLLEVNDWKSASDLEISNRLVAIYNLHKGQYETYFSHPQFLFTTPDVKNFMTNIFKEYSRIKGSETSFMTHQKRFFKELTFYETIGYNSNPNRSNKFFNMPEFNCPQEVESFHRKMYEIFKKSIPSIMKTVKRPHNSKPPQYFPLFSNQAIPFNHNCSPLTTFSPTESVPQFGFTANYSKEPSFMNHNHVWQPFISQQKQKMRFDNLYKQKQDKLFEAPINQKTISHFGSAFVRYQTENSEAQGYNTLPWLKEQEQSIHSLPRKLVKKDQQEVISKHLAQSQDICVCKCEQNPEQCILCNLKKSSPLSVRQTLQIFVISSNASITLNYSLPNKIVQQLRIKAKNQFQIELRCIEIPSKQTKWPEHLIVRINNQTISEFDDNVFHNNEYKPIILPKISDSSVNNGPQIELQITRHLPKANQIPKESILYAIGILLVYNQMGETDNNQLNKMNCHLRLNTKIGCNGNKQNRTGIN